MTKQSHILLKYVYSFSVSDLLSGENQKGFFTTMRLEESMKKKKISVDYFVLNIRV